MSSIYFFSGPCGCGKTTLANAYAKHIADYSKNRQIYLIHGDDFHAGFVKAKDNGFLLWKDILKFNWDCILTIAKKALDNDFDIVIDYVIEKELPLVQQLANEYDATLYYVVLTSSHDTIRQRLTKRGDVDLIERALFLKNKLDSLPENQGHIFDNTKLSVEEELERLEIEHYILKH